MGRLEGKRIAVLATDGFEQSELISPKKALESEGARVEVIAPHDGKIRGWSHTEWGESVGVDAVLKDTDAEKYDALMLPGGVMNPDQLRINPDAVRFVAKFVEARKPIAAICHGPWTLIEAGAVDGRRMTSYPSIKSDLINAGAQWSDEAFVIDRGLVTSRNPDDLPVFNQKMIEVFAEGPLEAPAAEERAEAGTQTLQNAARAPAARPKRKKTATTGARAKASLRKAGEHAKPRGAKQPPRRRAPRRR